jgi:hypothetical protein
VDLSHCPACRADSLSAYAWLASWPFHATCPACRVQLRRKQNLWLGVLCQPLGFIVIVLSAILGKSAVVGGLGVAAGLMIFLVPALMGRFVVLAEPRLAS